MSKKHSRDLSLSIIDSLENNEIILLFLPVPGNIRFKAKQINARGRGICGTARRNMPCLTFVELVPPALIDNLLLDAIDT